MNRSPAAITRLFIYVAGFTFSLTAAFKLVSVLGNSDFLGQPSPLIPGVTWRFLLFLAALTETGCAIYLFRERNVTSALFAALWLTAVLALFRLLLVLTGYRLPCHCFGFLGDWLGADKNLLDRAAWTVLGFLGVGGVGSLFAGRRSGLTISARHESSGDGTAPELQIAELPQRGQSQTEQNGEKANTTTVTRAAEAVPAEARRQQNLRRPETPGNHLNANR